MKEIERVVRIYEETLKFEGTLMAKASKGKKPSWEDRKRGYILRTKLARIRKRYLPDPVLK